MEQRDLQRVRQVVAYIFQRGGHEALSESQVWRSMAYDLHWLPPKEARTFAQALPRTGLVTRDPEGALRPAFDVKATTVPLDVRADPSLVARMPSEGTMLPPPDEAVAVRADQRASGATSPPPSPAPRSEPPPRPQTPAAPARDPRAASSSGPASSAPEPETLFGRLLQQVARDTDEPVQVWVQRMNETAADAYGLLTPEAALLLAAARRGLDVTKQARVAADQVRA